MPLSAYDSYFGGKPGSAAEAHAAMIRQYGSKKKADEVFYALVNQRKKLARHITGRR